MAIKNKINYLVTSLRQWQKVGDFAILKVNV
jgi:hypothetical protein